MRLEEEKTRRRNELLLELKYCERCGGLWLRGVGDREIYCAGCARAVAELPPASHDVEDSGEDEIQGRDSSEGELENGHGIDGDTWGGGA